jgi:hypothetical protein
LVSDRPFRSTRQGVEGRHLSGQIDEYAFETQVEQTWLGPAGWRRGDLAEWDFERALFPARALAFIAETQPKLLADMRTLHGSGVDTPEAGAIMDANGALYGTTEGGGGCHSVHGGCGTVFELTPPAAGSGTWTVKVLYAFGGDDDGAFPLAGLIMDAKGALYGTNTGNGRYDGARCSNWCPDRSAARSGRDAGHAADHHQPDRPGAATGGSATGRRHRRKADRIIDRYHRGDVDHAELAAAVAGSRAEASELLAADRMGW